MEAGRMGIPVVNTFFDNMTSSLNPNSLFYANHTNKGYQEIVDKLLSLIKERQTIPVNLSNLIIMTSIATET